MTLLLIVAVVIVIAVAAYFAVRLARSPVPVATQAEIEARQLDEGMIVGDPIPIGSPDDAGVVTVVPTAAAASTEADLFGESTGAVEPLPPRTNAAGSRATQTDSTKRAGATDQPKPGVGTAAAAGASSGTGAAAKTAPSNPGASADGRNPTVTEATKRSARAAAGSDTAAGGSTDPATSGAAPATTLTPRRHDIRWARRFEPADASFDDATRLNLLNDLGIVRAPWGVPLLAQAYEEEPDVEHRRAALRSLAAYRHPDTQGTFDVALHSDDEEERTIAEHALTALQIRAALPS